MLYVIIPEINKPFINVQYYSYDFLCIEWSCYTILLNIIFRVEGPNIVQQLHSKVTAPWMPGTQLYTPGIHRADLKNNPFQPYP